MSQINVQELAIAVAVQRNNPTILTPDFLKYSGIVPSDWELAKQPIVSNAGSQIVFQNRISIAAQVNRVVFSEPIAAKDAKEVSIADIARKYIEKLPEANYQGIGINVAGFVLFNPEGKTARNYIFETLLNSGPWQEVGNAPAQASMRFIYSLDGGPLTLEINEARIQLPDQKMIPAVLFAGSFSHNLPQNIQGNKLTSLFQMIANWQTDLEAYKEIVNTKFLSNQEGYQPFNAPSTDTVFPT